MMLQYWFSLFAVILPFYLLPGLIFSSLVKLPNLRFGSRCLIALILSLILMPYLAVCVGNVLPVSTQLNVWLIFVLAPLAIRLAGNFIGIKGPDLQLLGVNQTPSRGDRAELLFVTLFILGFALLMNIPRLGMLVLGDQVIEARPWDEYFHIAQTISVARSGIPPKHYLFPSLDLTYYFGSWILPAFISNQPFVFIPVTRSLAVHSILQAFAFLGLIYAFLRLNVRSRWARLIGLSFFTIFGGFDFFVTMSMGSEWWQTTIPWLVSSNQYSQFATLFMWVPHHVAAGMAFICLLILWKNVATDLRLKIAVIAILLSFILGTSPFIFLAIIVGGLIWLLTHRRVLWAHRQRLLRLMPGFLLPFLLGSWRQLVLYAQHSASLGLSQFRVPVFETLRGRSNFTFGLDRALTLLGSEVVLTWILMVEIGLPFLLYICWSIIEGSKRKTSFHRVFLIFPWLYFFLTILLADQAAGGGFVLRGSIPAQIMIAMAATFLVDIVFKQIRLGLIKTLIITSVVVFGIAQSISWLVDLDNHYYSIKQSIKAIEPTISGDGNPRFISIPKPEWPIQMEYIHWLNRNTPANALVLELGSPGELDDVRYRLLERQRMVLPGDASKNALFQRDYDFVSPAKFSTFKNEIVSKNILAYWETTSFFETEQPTYLVSWEGEQSGMGSPIFQDRYVVIYRIR